MSSPPASKSSVSALPHPRPRLEAGTTIADRYRVLEVLGEGSTGTVYAVEHLLLKKKMAVKLLHPELTSVKSLAVRFEREATATAKIEHPNVAAALDFGLLPDGAMFLALEFVEGRSLRGEIQNGPMQLKRALYIARQLASVLTVTQPLGIVHRDLKPENVILVQRGDDPDFVKVLDFGIARITDSAETDSGTAQPLTKLGAVFGTPEYMAPEQALGQHVDTRADFFSLGVILFEMIAGVRPFRSVEGQSGILAQQITQPRLRFADVAPAVCVPEAVERMIHRLLAKGVAERYQQAGDILQQLDELLANLPSAAASDARSSLPAPLPAFELNTHFGSASLGSSNPGGPQPPSTPVAPESAASVQPPSAEQPRLRAAGGGKARLLLQARELMASEFGPLLSRIPRPAMLAFGIGLSCGLVIAVAVWIAAAAKPNSSGDTAKLDTRASAASAVPAASASADTSSPTNERSVDASKDPDSMLAAAQAKLSDGRDTEAVNLVSKVLSKNPDRRSDAKVAEILYGLANSNAKDAADLAFSLLEGTMSSVGADLLYRLWLDKAMREVTRRRAEKWIRSEPFNRAAANSTQIAARLRLAETCEKKRDLLSMAAKGGTAFALNYLNELKNDRACGIDGKSECYPCLHKDDLLEQTIRLIEARLGK